MASNRAVPRRNRRITATRDDLSGNIAKALGDLTMEPNTTTVGSSSAVSTRHVVKRYGGVSKKGYAPYNPRKQNQDSLVMEMDPKSGALFLATLDGHGEAGDKVSQHFTRQLASKIFAHKSWPADPATAMCEVTAQLEAQVIKDSSIDTEFSGTTAVMCTIIGDQLIVINIGDSRIIRASDGGGGKLTVESVSTDHKPDDPPEKARIVRAGGRVFAVEYDDGVDGPARVWLGHMDIPGLAMSRSLGDTIAHTAGVSSEPDIIKRTLKPEDKFLVMATDGLWEFITNEEVVEYTKKFSDPKPACEMMAKEAHTRWMKEEGVVDDTTIIVAFLDVPRKS